MALTRALVFVILVLLLPSQLNYFFWPDFSRVFGIRVDLLAPALYFTDILTLLFIALNFKSFKQIKLNNWLVPLLVLLVFNIVFSIAPVLTLYRWIRLVLYALVIFVCRSNLKKYKKLFLATLPLSLTWVSFIGLLQVVKGSSLGGILYFLGERTFSTNSPGIALNKWGDIAMLRPYGTLPHPNVLAGFLGMGILVFYKNKPLRPLVIFWAFLLILCQSYSSLAALFVAVAIGTRTKLSKKIIYLLFAISLLSPFIFKALPVQFTQKSLIERNELAVAAIHEFAGNPIFGVGFGNFIHGYYGKDFTNALPSLRSLFAPVHNLPLLMLSEWGIFGLVLVSVFLIKPKPSPLIVYFFVISLFDHYLLTIHPSMLLAAFAFGLL